MRSGAAAVAAAALADRGSRAPAAADGAHDVSLACAEYTFEHDFTQASAPLLKAHGGPFNPYYTYFGGPPQPDGPNGYRWWNDELQVYSTAAYTPAPFDPFRVSGGVLSITGKPTPPQFADAPKPYVSGCLETSKGYWGDADAVRAARRGHEQKYGYWEIRCRIPRAKGVWAGFWLNGGVTPAGGPRGYGEIDVFEAVGQPRTLHQTAHDWWAPAHLNESYAWTSPFDYAAGFHTYGLLWTPDSIAWYVDGVPTRRASSALAARYRELCGPLHMAVNLGIGGSWPGAPDASTRFPLVMEVAFLRARALCPRASPS